jgi:hypothetical protein
VSVLTMTGGRLRAELVTEDGSVVPGFSRDDCDGVQGDSLRSHITWAGRNQAPSDNLRVRFVLKRARLYGFEFV